MDNPAGFKAKLRPFALPELNHIKILAPGAT
ncbi:hypothetical protein PAT3040_04406, partial [Paenibacillus agaridevorans]